MTILHVPVTFANIAEWVRRAGGAINQLITGKLDLSGGTLTGDLVVPDEAYGAGWNGSLEVPTKNALYDKIETISGGGVSDGDKGDIVVSSSGAVWEFDTGVVTAFAKTFLDDADAGAVRTTLSAAAASHTHTQADVTGLTTADSPQFAGINLGHASDTTLTRVSAGVIAIEGANVVTTAGATFTGDISVPDEAYDATNWNGSVEVPTKNAVRDKIEAITGRQWALVGAGQTAAGVWDFAVDGAKANVDFTGLAGYTDILLIADGVTKSVSGLIAVTVSVDNGSTFYTTSGDYVAFDGAGVETNVTNFLMHGTNATAARTGGVRIVGVNVAAPRLCEQLNNPTASRLFVASTSAINAVRINGNGGGNLTGGKIYCFAR